MPDQALDQLRKAVDAAAATFDRRGSSIRERELEMAVECALHALGLEPLRQVPLRLEEAWSGQVGGVDLALDDGEGSLTLIELKWDPNTLTACAWDSMKLAAALQAEEGQRAFLVAGSPDRNPPVGGSEVLDDQTIAPAELRRKFANDFDYWKADVKNHPKRAPTEWQTRAAHSASLEFKGAPWHIRIAEILLTDAALVAVE